MDWTAVRSEYVTTAMSYRELAEKHSCSKKAVADRGRAERWVALRAEHRSATERDTKTAVRSESVKRACCVFEATDILLEKLKDMVKVGELTPTDIRSLTSALKTIMEIYNIQSPLQLREQEARIKLLESKIETEHDSTVRVEFVNMDW